jgi:hypothetical protein
MIFPIAAPSRSGRGEGFRQPGAKEKIFLLGFAVTH